MKTDLHMEDDSSGEVQIFGKRRKVSQSIDTRIFSTSVLPGWY